MGRTMLIAAIAGIALAASSLQAQVPSGPSFRVETELFQGGDNEPGSRHKILFDRGVVYDLTEPQGRLQTMYDPSRGRVVLLDRQAQVKTELSTEELIEATAQLAVAARQTGKAEKFGLEAKVVDEGDRQSIAFGPCRYEATLQSVKNPEIPVAFHDFTVWASRLNVRQQLGMPPFARMALSDSIATAGKLPLNLTLVIERGLRKQKFRANHLVIETLSDLDRQAIRRIGDALAEYRAVPLDAFPME